jgi:hypothetical protein
MNKIIYYEVLRNLRNEQFYEKKDKQLLFQNLPYYLKNKLIMQMYRPIIQNFIFFKDIGNSDFIVKVATSLKPLISVKGDILIQEGDYIKEIFFVKKGLMGLSITINMNDPEQSFQKYRDLIAIEKNISHFKPSFIHQKTKKLFGSNLFFNKNDEESSYSEDDDIIDAQDINIIEIRAREHFGDALMFLNERSPLKARIRSRSAELFILRKMEAIEIYSIYPHIWTKINKKSLYNMDQIYLKIEKRITELCKQYKKKPKNNFLEKYKTIINQSKKDGTFLINNKKQIKNKDKDNNIEIKKDEVKKDDNENENQLNNKNESQTMTFNEMNNTIRKDSIKHGESLKTKRSKTLFAIGNKNNNEKNSSEITKRNSNENNK